MLNLDKVMGVPKEELHSIEETYRAKLKKVEERQKARTEARAKYEDNHSPNIPNAIGRVEYDYACVNKAISFLDKSIWQLKQRKDFLHGLLERIDAAREFVQDSCPEQREALLYYKNWRSCKELDYYREISELVNLRDVFPAYVPTFM